MLQSLEVLKTENMKLTYVIIMLMIVLSDDCFWFSTADMPSLKILKNVFILGLPIFLLVKNKNKITSKGIHLLTIVLLVTTCSGIVNSFALGGPLLLSIMFMGAILFTNKIPFGIFGGIFSNIILTLCSLSFVAWILASIPIISLNTVENIAGTTAYTSCGIVFFEGYLGEIRNACIFREPGVFMIFICLAFIFDIYHLKEISIYRIAIYILTIFSTYSTAGYIIFALCSIIYFLKKGSSHKIFLPLVLLSLGFYFILSSDSLMTSVFGKIEKGQDSASFFGRISSIIIPLNILIENPVFGVGTVNFRTQYLIVSKKIFGFEIDPDGMSTNTFMNAGAIYGIVFLVIILLGMYKLCNNISESTLVKILLFLIFMLMFSNETMIYSYIFILLIAYGYIFTKYNKN